jgi:hypothetical protein
MGLLPPKKQHTPSRVKRLSIGVVLSLALDAPDDIHMIQDAEAVSPNEAD